MIYLLLYTMVSHHLITKFTLIILLTFVSLFNTFVDLQFNDSDEYFIIFALFSYVQ